MVPGQNALGGGFLVNSGSKWFLQGLNTKVVKLRRSALVLATDFADEELRAWLRKRLDKLPIGKPDASEQYSDPSLQST